VIEKCDTYIQNLRKVSVTDVYGDMGASIVYASRSTLHALGHKMTKEKARKYAEGIQKMPKALKNAAAFILADKV
jgi:hypothetical protein